MNGENEWHVERFGGKLTRHLDNIKCCECKEPIIHNEPVLFFVTFYSAAVGNLIYCYFCAKKKVGLDYELYHHLIRALKISESKLRQQKVVEML